MNVADAGPRSSIAERVLSLPAWTVAVWAASALYALALSAESIADHAAYRTGFDTAIYDQLLWLLANGHEPFSTVLNRPLLADHFQPGLVLLTPLYWLGLGVPGLYVVQSVALAATAPALQALARASGASEPLAAAPALAWLVCPWVASVNLFEFRPTAFLPLLLTFGALAVVQRRDVMLLVTALLALSLKEDVALTYLALGVVIVILGRRRLGALLSAASVVWFLVASWAIEALGGSYDAFGQRFAGDRGETVGEAVVWGLTHPLKTLSDVVTDSLTGLVALVLSTGGLALLAPWWLLLAAPSAAYNALSAYTPQHDLSHHYHLGTLIGLFVASAVGVGRIDRLGRHKGRFLAGSITSALGVALLGGLVIHRDSSGVRGLEPAAVRSALDLVPDDAAVAAALPMLPHLSQRVEVYTLPEPFVSLEWGSSLTEEELAERAAGVRYVAYIEGQQVGTIFTGRLGTERAAPDVRPILEEEGFVVVARAGALEILERR